MKVTAAARGKVRLEPGNCLEVMRRLAEEGVRVDSIVTDPPYHLTSIVKRFGQPDSAPAKSNGATGVYGRASSGFMGKAWDGGDVAFNSVTWGTAGELLKPGGWLLAFGGTRNFHRLGWAIEGGGFEIRDQIAWMFGSGFPKSHDISKAIDRAAGAERSKVQTPMGPTGNKYAKGLGDDRPWMQAAAEQGYHEHDSDEPATEEAAQWEGWGTALKPAFEPVCVARKPLGEKTVAANVLKHGTGALNVDGCRVETADTWDGRELPNAQDGVTWGGSLNQRSSASHEAGRWPANVCHDGSPEVEAAFAAFGESKSQRATVTSKPGSVYGGGAGLPAHTGEYGQNDTGTASRFFYTAKADAHDRWGSKHPTVKPIDLMRWLVRLVTPPGGTVLDPFAGSGTTGIAAMAEGFDCILIEREEEYLADIRERLAFYEGEGRHSLAAKNRKCEKGHDDLPLFKG